SVHFFDAIFQDPVFQKALFGLGNGILVVKSKTSGKLNTIRLRIPMSKLKLVQLPHPDQQEQAAIVDHIAQATSSISRAIESARNELSLLKQFRTRLIADLITGKLDVTRATAKLPDERPEPTPLDEREDLAQDESTEMEIEAQEAV